SAASRRWKSARARGHLRNLETGRGKPARIVLADPLPDDIDVLPTVELLLQASDSDNQASSPRETSPAPADAAVTPHGDQPHPPLEPEIAAPPPPRVPTMPKAVADLTLDEALRDPNLHYAIGIDGVTTTIEDDVEPDPTRVLLERHEVGPHAIELW